MLEFYRMPDSVQLDQFIETQGEGFNLDEILLGQISFEEHIKLEEIIPKMRNISHYEDNHVDSIETKNLYKTCRHMISLSNVSQEDLLILRKICSILEEAVQFGEGIITVCD